MLSCFFLILPIPCRSFCDVRDLVSFFFEILIISDRAFVDFEDFVRDFLVILSFVSSFFIFCFYSDFGSALC